MPNVWVNGRKWPRRSGPRWWQRLLAYAFLILFYIYFAIAGGVNTGWASSLFTAVSAGFLSGFVVLLLELEFLRG